MGFTINDLQCKNGHELVLRTNDKLACVSESVAQKLNQRGLIKDMSQFSNVDETLVLTNDEGNYNNSGDSLTGMSEFVNIQPINSKIPYDQQGKPFVGGMMGTNIRMPPPMNIATFERDGYALFTLSNDGTLNVPTMSTLHAMPSASPLPLQDKIPQYRLDPLSLSPTVIPDGIEAKHVLFGEGNNRGVVMYFYAPNTVEIDELQTDRSFEAKHGIRILISTSDHQEPYSDGYIKSEKELYASKWVDYSFNGYQTISGNGSGDPHNASFIKYSDDEKFVIISSFHHSFNELKEIFESMEIK